MSNSTSTNMAVPSTSVVSMANVSQATSFNITMTGISTSSSITIHFAAPKLKRDQSLLNCMWLLWEYETLSGKWSPYSSRDQVTINLAYLNKKKITALKSDPEKFIDFLNMRQKNKASGLEKPLRCISTDDESAYLTFLWQHEHGKKWLNYNEEEQVYLNKAFGKRQKSASLPNDDPKKKLVINFERLIQKNKVSGWEQRVRCAIYDENFYVWQRTEDDSFDCYPPLVVLAVEAAYQRKESKINFYYKGDYELDFAALKEKNEENGSIRNVVREKINVKIDNGTISAITQDCPKYIAKKNEEYLLTPNSAKKVKLDLDPVISSLDMNLPSSNRSARKKSQNKNIPIDSECSMYGKCHIYCEGDTVYDVMLNQTNLQNNNNKFFIIQLLEDNDSKLYSTWFRWGRVGLKGQNNLIKFNSHLDEAKNVFEKKFFDKTKNNWQDIHHFEKQQGKYDLLKMDRSVDEDEIKSEVPQVAISMLDSKVYSLLKIICDKKIMEDVMKEMKYDAKKTPLGKLTLEQIRAGYSALNKIADAVNCQKKGQELLRACNEFYTRIPHSFGMKTPPIINSSDMIADKIRMLEALSEIHVAMGIMSGEISNDQHPIDKYYKSLDCDLKVLDRNSHAYGVIAKYLKNMHGSSHSSYTMELTDVYECYKSENTEKFKNFGNRKLLWHGSRLSNWVGILKNGLRIAPPEAPVTGYMFGKGIYFADCSSKSANYCYATQRSNDGLLLLCEVSLGNIKEEYNANYSAACLPPGFHSTMGVGQYRPSAEVEKISELSVPVGALERHPDSLSDRSKFCLIYNEYIVYDINQVKMKYLVHVKHNFK